MKYSKAKIKPSEYKNAADYMRAKREFMVHPKRAAISKVLQRLREKGFHVTQNVKLNYAKRIGDQIPELHRGKTKLVLIDRPSYHDLTCYGHCKVFYRGNFAVIKSVFAIEDVEIVDEGSRMGMNGCNFFSVDIRDNKSDLIYISTAKDGGRPLPGMGKNLYEMGTPPKSHLKEKLSIYKVVKDSEILLTKDNEWYSKYVLPMDEMFYEEELVMKNGELSDNFAHKSIFPIFVQEFFHVFMRLDDDDIIEDTYILVPAHLVTKETITKEEK